MRPAENPQRSLFVFDMSFRALDHLLSNGCLDLIRATPWPDIENHLPRLTRCLRGRFVLLILLAPLFSALRINRLFFKEGGVRQFFKSPIHRRQLTGQKPSDRSGTRESSPAWTSSPAQRSGSISARSMRPTTPFTLSHPTSPGRPATTTT